MGKFAAFLNENKDLYSQICDFLDELSPEELDEFGYVLYSEFFDESDDYDEDEFELSDIKDMIDELGLESYDDILDMLMPEELEDIGESKKAYIKFAGKKIEIKIVKLTKNGAIVKAMDPALKGEFEIRDEDLINESDEIDEAVSRIMKVGNMNKKKRKFMSTSKAELRRTKAKRKQDARKTKAARKRYYKANKAKIAKYQKSRAEAIKKGKHKVKKRRQA